MLQGIYTITSYTKIHSNISNSAVNQATSPVTAPTPQLRVLDVAAVVVVSLPVVDPKSATRYGSSQNLEELLLTFLSAPRSDTSPVTALTLVPVAMVEDSAVNSKADTVAVVDSAVVKVARPATPAADTDTCRETAPKARSATTVAKLDI